MYNDLTAQPDDQVAQRRTRRLRDLPDDAEMLRWLAEANAPLAAHNAQLLEAEPTSPASPHAWSRGVVLPS